MTLMRSISGMRGTIGGKPGTSLTPVDLVQFATAFAMWLNHTRAPLKVVIGRDGRVTGKAIKDIVISTLQLCGCDIVDLDLSTTPTVEMAVPHHNAGGGIILTASHNPAQWNALKFLNKKGEFISQESGQWILSCIEKGEFDYPEYTSLGKVTIDNSAIQRHVESICKLDLIDVDAIKFRKFSVVVDPVNSTGAISIPILLDALGVSYTMINGEVTGIFAHNPEPLPINLKDLSEDVQDKNADLGISVDPDVDRLVLISEDGSFFGEEYTLIAVADLVLRHKPGATVSNMSSSRALRDISNKYNVPHFQSAVGEVHVVKMMKECNAIIGGEGNGGVILPELHNGRDALVGIALFLQLMVEEGKTASELKGQYSNYVMLKEKIQLGKNDNADKILKGVANKLKSQGVQINEIDGVKIDFKEGWVHLRKSNTEPIIRLYTEGSSVEKCQNQISQIKKELEAEMSST